MGQSCGKSSALNEKWTGKDAFWKWVSGLDELVWVATDL
jgi:hypothetical protein